MDANERRRRASQEAAAWWVRIQGEDVPRADREGFVDWLRESAVHVAEMLRVAQVHGALEQFQRWVRISTDGPDDDEKVVPLNEESRLPPPPATTSRRRLWIGAIAATVAALAVAVGFVVTFRTQTIETERGERREVALADGSVVAVDPETRLRVAFEEHTRRVFLERGRALFRVANNPERPFFVEADGTTVRAVGTAFGVERQKSGTVVTVSEGKVAVFANADRAGGTVEEDGIGPTMPK
jgi:transmembrane sensor